MNNHSITARFIGIVLTAFSLVLTGTSCLFATDSPPKVGEVAKDFELKSIGGGTVKLTDVLDDGPVVLVVLRGFPGYQCPICSQQVGQLLNQAEKFKTAGVKVLLVYPGPSGKLAERAKDFIKDKTIPDHFQLLVDPDFAFTKSYNLRWNAAGETAYPSTFVIQKDRKISFVKISRTHEGRTKPDEILNELKLKP